MALKDNWKEVGKDFAKLGSDLGKSLVRSVKKGVDAVDNWSEDDSKPETIETTATDKTDSE